MWVLKILACDYQKDMFIFALVLYDFITCSIS